MILQIVYCAHVEAVMNKITHKQNTSTRFGCGIFVMWYIRTPKLSRKFGPVCWDYCSIYLNWCVLVFVSFSCSFFLVLGILAGQIERSL
ncbi:hypothetical protein LI328DRAFT_157920 [Trichoderma asperelloides]|nr:hypothetical protein LI328DRAFT_157920 [Trichoderma asperelloides]